MTNLHGLLMCFPINYLVPELHFNNFDVLNNLLNPMELLRNTRTLPSPPYSYRIPVDSSGFQWIPVDSSGFQWIPVDSSGLQWTPIGLFFADRQARLVVL